MNNINYIQQPSGFTVLDSNYQKITNQTGKTRSIFKKEVEDGFDFYEIQTTRPQEQ